MRICRRASCPRLAQATGLSLVTVHKQVAALAARGELLTTGEVEIRGGRPAPIYAFNPAYAYRAFLELSHRGGVFHAKLELTDLLGAPLSRHTGAYAALETESLDGWMDAALPHRTRPVAISISAPANRVALRPLCEHLQQRYGCPTAYVSPAAALASRQDSTATLHLQRGAVPTCAMRRHGSIEDTGRLDLLPLPCAWESLDYADHTLVEEMISRLLHIITCTLAPEHIVFHADFWAPRLTDRIRFNTQSKLKGHAPTLHFSLTQPESIPSTLRRYIHET